SADTVRSRWRVAREGEGSADPTGHRWVLHCGGSGDTPIFRVDSTVTGEQRPAQDPEDNRPDEARPKMKCRISENDVALYAASELPEGRFRAIDAHVTTCEECRGLVAELRETQVGLMRLRQDAVSVATLAKVRTRVLLEVSGVSSTTAWGRKLERLFFE